MGYVFAAFAWAYALFEIPGGWMGDWLGPRRVLLRIVTWWSICTAAMGWMWSLTSMIVTNFLFGAGEAGCFPNLTKVFTTWLPRRERVRAQGIMWMSARWGGAFTPMLVVWMLHFVNWRRTFQIFGGLGVIWAVFFYRWFRDNPARPSERQCSRTGAARRSRQAGVRPRQRALEEAALAPLGLAALDPVFLPVLHVLVLRHLAADLPARVPRGVAKPMPRGWRFSRCCSAASDAWWPG